MRRANRRKELMPKCNECGNKETFLTTYTDITVNRFDGDDEIDSWSISYERTDEPAECEKCGSIDIDGSI